MDPEWQAVREDGSPFPGQLHPVMVCLATGTPVKDVVMGVTSQDKREQRWLRIHANPLLIGGLIAGAYACFEDITERVSTNAQLADTREKLDLALAGANLGTYDAHLPTGQVEVNNRYLALLGYAPRELAMSVAEWMSRVHPDDLPRIIAHQEQILATTGKYFDLEYRLRHKDGHWVWLHDRGRVFETDAANNPVRVAGTQLDISLRKEAELALQESETRYRTIVESAPDAILICVDLRVVMANPACVKLFGAAAELDLLGKSIWSLSSQRSHRALRQRILPSGGVNRIAEIDILRLDGKSVSVDGVSVAIEYQGRRAIHVMMHDATPRKHAESLLRQHREEMERALAYQIAQQTVAGIAHELNQPLNAITRLAEAIRRQAANMQSLPTNMSETLQGITRAAQRAGRVIHEMMSFLRKPDLACEAVDLTKLLQEAVVQCQAGLSFSGEIEVILPDDLPHVAGNALRIEKIVGNLLRNAVDASQGTRSTCQSGKIVIVASAGEQHVRLFLEDNGPGVAAELLQRLFEPFVSNKPGGIGMGLSISHALARSMGGSLDHTPTPDGGARFCLSLPVYSDASMVSRS